MATTQMFRRAILLLCILIWLGSGCTQGKSQPALVAQPQPTVATQKTPSNKRIVELENELASLRKINANTIADISQIRTTLSQFEQKMIRNEDMLNTKITLAQNEINVLSGQVKLAEQQVLQERQQRLALQRELEALTASVSTLKKNKANAEEKVEAPFKCSVVQVLTRTIVKINKGQKDGIYYQESFNIYDGKTVVGTATISTVYEDNALAFVQTIKNQSVRIGMTLVRPPK